MIYLLILMIVMIVLYAVKPQKFKFFQPHKAFFVILTFLIGPFLIVQFLKNFLPEHDHVAFMNLGLCRLYTCLAIRCSMQP